MPNYPAPGQQQPSFFSRILPVIAGAGGSVLGGSLGGLAASKAVPALYNAIGNALSRNKAPDWAQNAAGTQAGSSYIPPAQSSPISGSNQYVPSHSPQLLSPSPSANYQFYGNQTPVAGETSLPGAGAVGGIDPNTGQPVYQPLGTGQFDDPSISSTQAANAQGNFQTDLNNILSGSWERFARPDERGVFDSSDNYRLPLPAAAATNPNPQPWGQNGLAQYGFSGTPNIGNVGSYNNAILGWEGAHPNYNYASGTGTTGYPGASSTPTQPTLSPFMQAYQNLLKLSQGG